jgi:hypothetical protein
MKIKTVWERWIEKVEAAWPITATEIAKLCDIDHKTATRIRDHIAQARQEEPPRASGGVRPVSIDDKIVDEIASLWPISLKEIARRYNRGKTVARRLQRAAIARHGLTACQGKAKQSKQMETAFAKLDQYLAEHGKTNRDDMRAYAHCSWSTVTEWRKARGIYEPARVTSRKLDRMRAAGVEVTSRYTLTQAAAKKVEAEKVAAKPQHYAPGRWFRNKRSGEIVPALFVVSGSEVKFFGVTT